MNDEEREERYREIIRRVNREWYPLDDEAIIEAHDALTEVYDLDRYLAPLRKKKRRQAKKTADEGGFCLPKGGDGESTRNRGASKNGEGG